MKLSIIVAMDNNRLIGRDNQLPWHLPADLAHFKKVTMGKPIIMGRKTFESIGKALPGRRNVVLTRQSDWQAPDCDVVHSLQEALELLSEEEEAMIIGGAILFQESLAQVSTLHLTFIDGEFEGDTYFPDWSDENWQIASQQNRSADDKNPYAMRFVELVRSPGSTIASANQF